MTSPGPDFICIGAQKAGTTWLYENLARHPGTWKSPVKDIHYFDELITGRPMRLPYRLLGRSGFNRWWRKNLVACLGRGDWEAWQWHIRYFFGRRSDGWYLNLFAPSGDPPLVKGDFTPDYAALPEDMVRRIAAARPSAKIIFIMRDPVERAWSHAVMDLVRNQGRPLKQISPEAFQAHFTSQSSRLRGDYAFTLRTWRQHFGRERVLAAYFEQIKESPEAFIRQVHAFLGLETSPESIPQTLKEKVHDGKSGTIPPDHLRFLSRLYLEQLETLSNEEGSHCTDWFHKASQLADPEQ